MSFGGWPVGVWWHFAMIYDRTTLSLYINGDLVSQLAWNTPAKILPSSSYYMWIGSMNNNPPEKIDEIRISKKARQPWEFNVPLRNGLVAYYPFNGNANDESWNGNNGVVSGATLTSDRFGESDRAFYFNGSSYIDCGSHSSTKITGSLTISAWIRPTEMSGDNSIIVNREGEYEWGINNNAIWYALATEYPGWIASNPVGNLETAQWFHVALHYDSTAKQVTIYKDGISLGHDSAYGQIGDVHGELNNLIIGFRQWGIGYFKGDIDDIRIYNRAISQSEIDSLYHEGGWPPPYIVNVVEGWNMLSIPFTVLDYSKSTLFESAISDAFSYNSSYIIKDILKNGEGYWLKYPSGCSIPFWGSPRINDTIDVSKGWNMIGSLSVPFPIDSISSIPSGLITSEFFKYTSIYEQADTIKPGKAYWVRMNDDGRLVLSTSGTIQSRNKIKIIATDEMPPLPPDIRNNTTSTILTGFALEQNYPNPFNPITAFKYQLPIDSKVTFRIYDIVGREVQTLINEVQTAGYKSVEWNASSVASGVYFYRLDAMSVANPAKSFSKLMKLVLIR